MLRKNIEELMKQRGLKTIVIVINENDKLGMLCSLQGGVLIDCYAHRVDRKKDIWGFISFENQKPIRKGWSELLWL